MGPKRDPLIYIAGPISTGNQFSNVGTALRMHEHLLKAGVLAFAPHSWAQNDLLENGGRPYEAWMQLCLRMITKCDAVLRMQGHSPGADRETAFAARMGLPIFDNADGVIEWVRHGHLVPASVED